MRWLGLIVLLPAMALAQGGLISQQAIQPSAGIPSTSVRVCAYSSTPTFPCPATVQIYSDAAMTAPVSNPALVDSQGNLNVFAAPGIYTCQFLAPQYSNKSIACTASAPDAPLNGNNQWTGVNTFTNTVNFLGSVVGFNLGSSLACPSNSATDADFTTAIAGAGEVVIPANCVVSLTGNHSVGSSVTLRLSQGSRLSVTTGTTITILGNIIAGRQQIFANALAGQGTIDFTGNYALEQVYPEWWGAAPGNPASVNTPAMQAAEVAAFGNNRTNASGLSKWNKTLRFADGCYDINAELQFYHVLNFTIEGEGKLKSCINQTATNQRIIDGQSIAYGIISNMSFQTSASQDATHPLVDIDKSGAQGADLAPQFITFQDVGFQGNGLANIGVEIAKSGATAQGSNINFYNAYGKGFLTAVGQIGTASSYAYNAIDNLWEGGDIQSSPQYGLASYAGTWTVKDTTFENGLASQTGQDVHCEVTQDPGCVIENVRSESMRLIAGDNIVVKYAQTLFQANQWDNFSLAGHVASVGDLVTGGSYESDGAYYAVTVGGTWGGLNTTAATSGSSTTIVCGTCNWTVNAYQNMRAGIVGGKGAGAHGVISSNTATTLTVASWINPVMTTSSFFSATPPDATSTFIVEPNWGTQTTSGTVTFAASSGYVIDGTGGSAGSRAVLENVDLAGLPINVKGSIKNLRHTRADWVNPALVPLDNTLVTDNYSNIKIYAPCPGCLIYLGAPLAWSFPRNSLTGISDASFDQHGTVPVCWAAGNAGGGAATLDACIKGNGSGQLVITNNSSNTALQTTYNKDGTWTDTSVAFGSLPPAAANGSHIYCSDCKNVVDNAAAAGAACVSGGSGAFARRQNSRWDCN